METAAVDEERGEIAPVVAAAVFIDGWGAAHFAAADEEDLVGEPAGFDVFDEGGDRVVEGAADVFHACGEGGVIDVGVHVPDEAGGDGDEAGSAFAETSGEEELAAERLGVGGVVVEVFPLGADAGFGEERCGVVAGDGFRVFAGEVEGVEDPAVEGVEGLGLEPVETR